MAGIENIDYSNWDKKFYSIAQESDIDGVFGLSKKEQTIFQAKAIEDGIDTATITELFGGNFKNKTRANNTELENALNYYNKLDSFSRSVITSKTYEIGEENLYNLEKEIDQAFIDCEAYQDILIVPQKRPKPEKLLNFDIEYLRNITEKDMEALHELKEKIEYVIENANEEPNHTSPERTPYDIDALAMEKLGMSYEEFREKYKEELEFCKTVTYADLNNMTQTQRYVYSKAKAYAKEMLLTTINEAHTVRWDYGERLTEEISKYNNDFIEILYFEDKENLTTKDINSLSSGIMRKSFKEALIKEYTTTDIKSTEENQKIKKSKKVITKDGVIIENPDGTKYKITGQKTN